LLLGLAATLWQARQARLEAQRASAVQAFLFDIFRRNSARQPDPERARATTARELLDLGVETLDHSLAGVPSAQAEVSSALAGIYSELGLTERAAEMARKALVLTEQMHGADSLQAAGAIAELASHLHHVGGLEERRALLTRALAITRRAADRPSTERVHVYRQLAQLEQSGDLAAAVRYAEAAVADSVALPAPEERFLSLETAGSTHLLAGDLPRAEERLLAAMALAGAIAPSETMRARAHLGEAQMQMLKVAEAEATLRAALADSLRLNGASHLDSVQTMFRLGIVIDIAGRPRDALALFEQALSVADRPGATDEFTAPTLMNVYGQALSKVGRHDDAIAALRRGIEIRDRQRPNTPMAATLRETLSRAFIGAGRLAEAQRAAEAARTIRLGNGDQPGRKTWQRLSTTDALLHLARGDADAAQRALDEGGVGGEPPAPLSMGSLDAGLLRAEIELERGLDADALRRLQRLRDQLAGRRLAPVLPLVEARRLLACGRWSLRNGQGDAAALIARSLALRERQLGSAAPAVLEAQRWAARASAPASAGPAACE